MNSLVKNKIIISGLPRSGSTLLGNILGSGKNVEYFFEPPMSSPMFSVIDQLDEKTFKTFFDYYMQNELLMPSLAGRRLNFNAKDDSYIYKYKTEDEIKTRLDKSWRASEIMEVIGNYSMAFKTPGISSHLLKLMKYYPDWKLVIIFRKYEDILKSILVKGWFDDNNPNIITTYKHFGASKVPVSIPEIWREDWINLNPTERSMIYMNEQFTALKLQSNYLRIDYENLIKEPLKTVENIFQKLEVNMTHKTEELITKIYNNPNSNIQKLPVKCHPQILTEALSHKDHFDI
ncbi:MAG: sulfotransferase [Salibacteraceae bacterium]